MNFPASSSKTTFQPVLELEASFCPCVCVQAVLYPPRQGDHQMVCEASSCFKAQFKWPLLEAFLSVPLSQSICFLLYVPAAHMCICLRAFIPFCLASQSFACLFPILSYKLCERGEVLILCPSNTHNSAWPITGAFKCLINVMFYALCVFNCLPFGHRILSFHKSSVSLLRRGAGLAFIFTGVR